MLSNELWTKVSSRSRTSVFFPCNHLSIRHQLRRFNVLPDSYVTGDPNISNFQLLQYLFLANNFGSVRQIPWKFLLVIILASAEKATTASNQATFFLLGRLLLLLFLCGRSCPWRFLGNWKPLSSKLDEFDISGSRYLCTWVIIPFIPGILDPVSNSIEESSLFLEKLWIAG